MNPFIYDVNVESVLISCRADCRVLNLLESLGIGIILTIENDLLPVQIRDHPDMSLHPVQDDLWVAASNVYDYYNEHLQIFGIKCIKSTSNPVDGYPEETILNVGRVGNCYIHNGITDRSLQEELHNRGISLLPVKQGYSKCSTLNINYDTIITSDRGIHSAALSRGYISYLLPPGGIVLPGYDTGFIGGCGGMIEPDTLFLTGDPELYEHGNLLIEILQREKIDAIYPKGIPMTDLGSILGLIKNGG